MLRYLVHLSLLLNSLVVANVRLTPVPSQATSYHTHTITKSVVHTSIIRRAGPHPASQPLHYEDHVKRSDDLHSLHVPFQDEEGYMSLYLSNITAIPFCKGVGATLYEDSAKVFLALNVKTQNATTIVPVREDKAIEFCQNIRKGEGSGDGTTTSKASGRPSETAEISDSSTSAAKSDAEKTTEESSVKPTKAADKSTAPISASATPSQDHGSSKTVAKATSDPASTAAAQPTKSSQPTTKPAASTGVEKDTTTTEVVHITSSANLKEEPSQVTTNADAKQGEETDATTTEVVYITPTADSMNEVMPETSFAEGSAEPTGKSKSADDKSASSKLTPTASVVEEGQIPSKTDSVNEDITTRTKPPIMTFAPKATSRTEDVESLEHTDNQADAKVAEIGHQKTRLITSTTSGAAVKPRTWESKGKKRVEILEVGLWRKRRSSKEASGKDDQGEEKESERVPAPHRPTPTSSSPHSPSDDGDPASSNPPSTPTATRKPLPSNTKPTDDESTKTSSTTEPTRPKTTNASVQDINTISFSFPTSAPLSNPQHHSPPNPHSPSAAPAPAPGTDSVPSPYPSEHELSSAFGAIHDPRMVWTVRFMWVIAGLQIVCGLWEFVKNATGGRGRWKINLIGRWGGLGQEGCCCLMNQERADEI